MKEAAVQRRHNLYRDSIVLTNSDPNLHLLGETPSVEWSTKFGGEGVEGSGNASEAKEGVSSRRRKQVVSMIQLDGVPLPYESCLEVPGVELIPEEDAEMTEGKDEGEDNDLDLNDDPKSPDSVNEIRGLINPMLEMVLPASERIQQEALRRTETEIRTGTIVTEDGVEDITHVTTKVETVSRKSVKDKSSTQAILQELKGSKKQEANKPEEVVAESTNEEMEVQEDASKQTVEVSAAESDTESSPKSPLVTDSSLGSDSGFQSLTSKGVDDVDPLPLNESLNEEIITSPVNMV